MFLCSVGVSDVLSAVLSLPTSYIQNVKGIWVKDGIRKGQFGGTGSMN